MLTIQELEDISVQVRRDVIRMVSGVQSGHPGGALGAADFLTALYFKIMKPNPRSFIPDGKGEDLFFLSNGHYRRCGTVFLHVTDILMLQNLLLSGSWVHGSRDTRLRQKDCRGSGLVRAV